MKKITLALSLIFLILQASAMKISGNLQIQKPTIIEIVTTNGKQILAVEIKSSGKFESKEVNLVPDIYHFKVGDNSEVVYLENTNITITGFLDPASVANSQLEFTGIEANEQFYEYYAKYKQSKGDPTLLRKWLETKAMKPEALIGLAKMNAPKTYEDAKVVYNLFPKNLKNNSYTWFANYTDSLKQYRLGGPTPPFSLIDDKGKTVKLSDFKGKYVVLDFWASWCGPCRAEMAKMKEFYPEFKNSNIVFVSISLDDTKEKFEQGLNTVQIPWVKLWDASGGFKVTKLKQQYGFIQIPFVMIVDKNGNQLERNIRGEDLYKRLKQLK